MYTRSIPSARQAQRPYIEALGAQLLRHRILSPASLSGGARLVSVLLGHLAVS